MTCPTCGAAARKNGHDNNGSQKYRCVGTPAHSWSDSTGREAGRPRLGAEPLTAAEKMRRYRERQAGK